MVEAVLQKEERFMLGDWFYEVGIVAYLQRQDLIRDQVSLTDSKNKIDGIRKCSCEWVTSKYLFRNFRVI